MKAENTKGDEGNTNSSKRRSNSSDSQKKRTLIKTSLELEKTHSKDEKPSMWARFKVKMSNFKNNIKYNTFTLNSFLDYYAYEVIRVFDQIYLTKDDFDKFSNELYYVIYLTYRSDFPPVWNYKNETKYATDCGWGCMIRTGQMIFARGVQLVKFREAIQNIKNLKKANNLDNSSKLNLTNLTMETIMLFMENYLPCESNSESKSVPNPFSIQNICNQGELLGKAAGEWFSDVNMINILSKLNSEYQPIKNLQVLHFTEGVIYGNQILENTCNDSKFLIFISVRQGLTKLTSEYIQSIKDFFQLPYNIGIIGGRDYNAHYFIGSAGENLLYLDPHLNQSTVKSKEDLIKDPSSYLKKQIYQTNLNNMSPAFTLGFCIQGEEEYDTLISALKIYTNQPYAIFSYKEREEKGISDPWQLKEEDDF